MKELIERLERATGPDRELDVAIVYALYPDIGPYQGQCIGDEPIFWHDPYRKRPAPSFTSSIDAALTLVPEGHGWVLDYMDPGEPDGAMVGAHACDGATFDTPRPPALALCIAALKAREALAHSPAADAEQG